MTPTLPICNIGKKTGTTSYCTAPPRFFAIEDSILAHSNAIQPAFAAN